MVTADVIAWLAILKVYFEKIRTSNKWSALMVNIFWFLFIVGISPFIIRAAQMGRAPVTCFIVLTSLTLVPILSRKNRVALLVLAALMGVAGNVFFRSEISYTLFILVFLIGGYIISEKVSNKSVELIKQLNQLSTHDAMTGLYNRRTGITRASVLFEQ